MAPSVEVVKQQIVAVYLQAPKQIAHMVQEAIVAIAQRDFPQQWEYLLPQLVPVLNVAQYSPEQTLRVLKLMRKLFEKYEYSSRSDPLYSEIIVACDATHNALLALTTYLVQQLSVLQGDIPVQLKLLKSCLRVFYYLNFQDIHPLFEDALQTWMQVMQSVLKLQSSTFPTETFKCKGEALRIVLLYATKYREDFENLIQIFSQEIWAVCTNTTHDAHFDKILHNALRYFKSLVAWQDMKPFFQANMVSLIENLIIKNLAFTSTKIALVVFQRATT